MKIRDPQKLAENLLVAVNSKASGTSKVALAWFLALVFLWLGGLEPIVPKLNALYDKSRKEFSAVSELQSFKVGQYGGDEAKRQKQVQSLEDQVRTTRAERVKILRAAKVPFSVPGFPAFDVPTRLASLAWSILLFGLMLYLASARSTILVWVAHSGRLLREAGSEEPPSRPPIVLFVPWWVAPLPHQDGACVTAEEFRSLVGWKNPRLATIGVVSALSLLCVLQFRVSLIGINSAFDLLHPGEGSSLSLLIGLSFIVLMATVASTVAWFLGHTVTEQELQGARPRVLSRRTFLVSASISAGTLLLSFLATTTVLRNSKLVSGLLRAPRYRRQKKPPAAVVDLPVGFHLNKKSRVIHYVSGLAGTAQRRSVVGLRLPEINRPRRQNFTPVVVGVGGPAADRTAMAPSPLAPHAPRGLLPLPISEGPAAWLNRGKLIRTLETAAIDNWLAGRTVEACQLLYYGVMEDIHARATVTRRPVSMYYRLAKFAYLSGQEDWVPQMVQAIQAAKLEGELGCAIRSWSDPKSRWRKKLKYVR
jgi:hypothetical protein